MYHFRSGSPGCITGSYQSKDGVGFGIEYVEDLSGMKVPVDIK